LKYSERQISIKCARYSAAAELVVVTDLASEFGVLSLQLGRLCRQALYTVQMMRLSTTRCRHLRCHVNIGRLHLGQVPLKSTTHITGCRLSLTYTCNMLKPTLHFSQMLFKSNTQMQQVVMSKTHMQTCNLLQSMLVIYGVVRRRVFK